MRAAVIAELEIGDLPASNGTIVANLRRRCGDHELALVVKDQGTTEHKNSREPPKPRKHDITVGGFISVCSVCSVVKKKRDSDSAKRSLAKRDWPSSSVGHLTGRLLASPIGALRQQSTRHW